VDAIPESAHIALTIQAVGIVLVTTLCCLLTRSIRRRFLDYWAISWGALTVSLSALLIAFCQPVPPRPFYTLYFLGEYAFGYLFVAGCRSYVSGFALTRRSWRAAVPAVMVAVGLPQCTNNFAIMLVPHAMIVTGFWAYAFWVLRRSRNLAQASPGLRVVCLALLFLVVEFTQYTLTAAYSQATGDRVSFAYMRYSSLYDLILEIFLVFGTVMIVMESVRSELESANHELAAAGTRLRAMVERDPLTDALNRHAFYSLVENRQRWPAPCATGSVVVADMDNLKAINDGLGHAAGDKAIRKVASAIRAVIRADDLLFRWGGDEFLVVLVGLPEPEARQRIECLNRHLDEGDRFADDESLRLAVSYGIAGFVTVNALDAAIDRADREMYDCKQRRKATPTKKPLPAVVGELK
jgi:diguanylate cyclase (GGDEF)-like protein